MTVVGKGDRDDRDILAADGLDDLGGLDFDALVVELIGAQAAGQADAWQDDAHGATETLSRLSTAALPRDGGAGQRSASWSRRRVR